MLTRFVDERTVEPLRSPDKPMIITGLVMVAAILTLFALAASGYRLSAPAPLIGWIAFAAIMLGLLWLLLLVINYERRIVRRQLEPMLAKDLAPFRPSANEIAAACKLGLADGFPLCEYIKPDRLAQRIAKPQDH